MKYLDEYSYGIYPYVPEHMETGDSQPVFENAADARMPQDYTGDPETQIQPQNIRWTPEKLPPDAFDNWETQYDYGYRRFREENPYYFLETQRYGQPQKELSQYAMPADPFPYNYPHNLNLALGLMQEALAGENEDKLFYAQLLGAAPTQEDRDIISGIRNDEMNHFELFRKLYFEHTGQILPQPVPYENGTQMTYCEGLKQALLGEVAAVEKYRKILFAMQDRRHINILTEILTDEIRHADLFGLLFDINACQTK